jgi:type VI secretion system protein VasJ
MSVVENMQSEQYMHKICQPISAQKPEGLKLVDDGDLDFIESQLMKVGSLSHNQVQWQAVQEQALGLLADKSKDLKILSHLLQCILHQGKLPQLHQAVDLLHGFMQRYWLTCYPTPGKKGQLPRLKLYTMNIKRITGCYSKVTASDIASFSEAAQKPLLTALQALIQLSEDLTLPVVLLEDLLQGITGKFKNLKKAVTPVSTTPKIIREESQATFLAIDGSSDSKFKQSLIKVADVIAENDSGFALALRIRRFATWQAITSAPAANSEGATELMAVPTDRVQEYTEAVEQGATSKLWQQIEKSVAHAPFWIDAHYLSYQVSKQLKQENTAQVIQEEAHNFLLRIPKLLALQFKDGQPFVSSDTQKWLSTTQNGSSTMSITQEAWSGVRAKVMQLADEGQLQSALTLLDQGLARSQTPRDQFYWRLLLADLLYQNNLQAVALQHYQWLLQQAESTSVPDWEPVMLQKIRHLLTQE